MQKSSTGKHGGRPLYCDSSRVLQQRARDSDSWPTFTLPDLSISLEIHERPDCFVLLSIFFQARLLLLDARHIPHGVRLLKPEVQTISLEEWLNCHHSNIFTHSLQSISLLGPVSQKSRTIRARRRLCCCNNFYSLYNIWKDQLHRISGSECYECLFGPETFSWFD